MKRFQTEFIEKHSECTEENYYDMLGCVPPRIMVSNAFLVGEPEDHESGTGHARYALYFTEDGKYYYGGKTTLADFLVWVKPSIEDAPEQGKQYALTGAEGDRAISNGNSWAESEIKK